MHEIGTDLIFVVSNEEDVKIPNGMHVAVVVEIIVFHEQDYGIDDGAVEEDVKNERVVIAVGIIAAEKRKVGMEKTETD